MAGGKVLQPLLVRGAEALFLVHDDQSQILVDDPFASHRAGADDDADGAVREPRLHRLLLGGARQTGQAGDGDAGALEPGAEAFPMLLGENRRRGGDGNLTSRQRRHGDGAKRNLGLAEADIADDQPVHRPTAREIGSYRLDCGELVGRFGEGKATREPLIVGGRRIQHGRRLIRALRREGGELTRGLRDRLVDLAPSLVPARAVELVQPDRVLLRTIAPQSIGFRDGHEARGVVGITQGDRVAAFRRVARHRLDAHDHGEAMILVDNDIARSQLHAGIEPRYGAGRGRAGQFGPAADQIGGGNRQYVVAAKAAIRTCLQRQQRAGWRRCDLGPITGGAHLAFHRIGKSTAEEAQVALASDEDGAIAGRQRIAHQSCAGAERRILLYETGRRIADALYGDDAAVRERLSPGVVAHDVLAGSPGAPLLAVGDQLQQPDPAFVGRGGDRHLRAGQLVEQGCRRLARRRLRHPTQFAPFDFVRAPLVDRIVAADRGDFPFGHLDPQRLAGVGREDVENLPAKPDLPRLVDPLVCDIADVQQRLMQRGEIDLVAERDRGGSRSKSVRRRIGTRRRLARADQRDRRAVFPFEKAAQSVQAGNPLADIRGRSRGSVAGQGVAAGTDEDGAAGAQGRQRFGDGACRDLVADDGDQVSVQQQRRQRCGMFQAAE